MDRNEEALVTAFVRGRAAQTVAVFMDQKCINAWRDFLRRRRSTLARATPELARDFLEEYAKTHTRREMAIVPGSLRRLHEYLAAAGLPGANPFGPAPHSGRRGFPLPPLPSAAELQPPHPDALAIVPAAVYPPRPPQPVAIVRDLSREYAQLAIQQNSASVAELWVSSATFDLRLVLSAPQVAMLLRGAAAFVLFPVIEADIAECFKPTIADRRPEPLAAAYDDVIANWANYERTAAPRTEAGAAQ